MAAAILIDATIIRMLLVPAVMHLFGRANWWLPDALERRLPQLHIEGHPEVYLARRGLDGDGGIPAQQDGDLVRADV
jgi:putative drug exporter of the RND superfamily